MAKYLVMFKEPLRFKFEVEDKIEKCQNLII